MAKRKQQLRYDQVALEGRTSRDGEEIILSHVHDKDTCLATGLPCCVHNRSEHLMRSFPQLWRSDRALMERLCPHGIGHPDPDHMSWYRRTFGEEDSYYEGIHGCDGCCHSGLSYDEILEKDASFDLSHASYCNDCPMCR